MCLFDPEFFQLEGHPFAFEAIIKVDIGEDLKGRTVLPFRGHDGVQPLAGFHQAV